jgi:LAS superfamily LD-carboxypeptidase LdcB
MGHKNRSALTIVLLVIYLLLLIGVVLFKLPFYSRDYHTERVINLIPLMGSFDDNGVIVWCEILQNVLIFIPLGIYSYMLGFKHKLRLIIEVTLVFEVIQLALALGVADITDVIANTLGGVTGICVCGSLRKISEKHSRTIISIGAVVATVCVLAKFAGLFYLSHFVMARERGEITPPPSDIVRSATDSEPTQETTESAPDASVPSQTPDILLVNANNPLPNEYQPENLVNLYKQKNKPFQIMSSDIEVSESVFNAMVRMFTAAQNDGVGGFIITSGYRTYAEQREVFNTSTEGIAALPGCSEHETGLAFDVGATNSSDFSSTPQFDWLIKHCAEYGFILRYPNGKEYVTGISYEPWHYRYVGVDAANKIMESGVTLEEYLGADAVGYTAQANERDDRQPRMSQPELALP